MSNNDDYLKVRGPTPFLKGKIDKVQTPQRTPTPKPLTPVVSACKVLTPIHNESSMTLPSDEGNKIEQNFIFKRSINLNKMRYCLRKVHFKESSCCKHRK